MPSCFANWLLASQSHTRIQKHQCDNTAWVESHNVLPNHSLKFTWFDTACSSSRAEEIFPLVHSLFDPDVYIGPGCSGASESGMNAVAAATGADFPIPVISWGAGSPALGVLADYPMFSRVVGEVMRNF